MLTDKLVHEKNQANSNRRQESRFLLDHCQHYHNEYQVRCEKHLNK